jgi:hypothetical protein
MYFKLGVQLIMHYTSVAVKSLLLNHKIILLSHSCWSSGQCGECGSLPLSKGLRLCVQICSGDEPFSKIIFENKCLKTVKNELKNEIKLLIVQN